MSKFVLRRWAQACAALAVALTLLPWQTVSAQQAEVQPAAPQANNQIVLAKVASGFSLPVFVADAGDNSGRLFVVEKGGVIRIIKNGAVLPQPFLDISDHVGTESEAGMLSVAFPADFATSGYFFVYYNHKDKNLATPTPIDAGQNNGNDTVIARFRVSAADPNRADASSEQRILVRNQPYVNHKGGLIQFGPDGYLYIGLGDGGSGGDPQNHAQTLDTMLGKILRIQVGPTGTYTVPATNPFASASGTEQKLVWDYGLRNPWRWSFDRATGDLYIADVGQDKYEEVDVHPAGTPAALNFGWRCKEGNSDYNNNPPCRGTLAAPIAVYDHSQGDAIVGGYVYRGSEYPTLKGIYFFADNGSGKIWSMQKSGNGYTTPQLELDTSLSISSFGEDKAGELYVVDLNGTVYKVTSTAVAPAPPPPATDFLYLPRLHK